jgi:hypothetical protein
MTADCREWYRTKAQPLDFPSFSRIKKTSIREPYGAKTASRSASAERVGGEGRSLRDIGSGEKAEG